MGEGSLLVWSLHTPSPVDNIGITELSDCIGGITINIMEFSYNVFWYYKG